MLYFLTVSPLCITHVLDRTYNVKTLKKHHLITISGIGNCGIMVLYRTETLQNRLGNPKDKLEDFGKSSIYEIECKDCDSKYYGQTRIRTRFK